MGNTDLDPEIAALLSNAESSTSIDLDNIPEAAIPIRKGFSKKSFLNLYI